MLNNQHALGAAIYFYCCLFSARALILTPTFQRRGYKVLDSCKDVTTCSIAANHFSLDSTRSGNESDDAKKIRKMLWKMTRFFDDMVDDKTKRFHALNFPQSGERKHQHVPIRDLAAAWDASKALLFFNGNLPHLEEALCTTLQFYNSSYSISLVGDDIKAHLDSTLLQEPSNIAHSALMLLASSGALKLPSPPSKAASQLTMINPLTQGILSMQRDDGAFRIQFAESTNEGISHDDNVYQGIEFYPGEAMVALLEVYELCSLDAKASTHRTTILKDSTRQAILPAMSRAFEFYSTFHKQESVDTNYNIWQIQAFSRLLDALLNDAPNHCFKNMNGRSTNSLSSLVASYVIELCEEIIESRSWKHQLLRGRSFYPNLETVEIACGLDALADGIRAARNIGGMEESARRFEYHAKRAVDFLQWSQDQVPHSSSILGHGGLGYGGIQVFEQRLDVTGHAISSLIKMHNLLEASEIPAAS